MLDPAARPARHRRAGLLLQTLLCSSGSLLSTRMLTQPSDTTSLLVNRSFTTDILQRNPGRFQEGLNTGKSASSMTDALSFLLQAPRSQTDNTFTDGLATWQDTHRCCCTCRNCVTAHVSPAQPLHNLGRELSTQQH